MKKISRKSFLKLAAATAAGTAMAPALMGCAWPDTQDRTPYKGDIVLLLSNDIHSNLGTSKIMSTDGSTRITGGVARMAAAQAGVRHRAFGKTLTLDGGDYSQGTPYQDGYQKGWEILALAEMQVDFCTLGNHEFDVGDQAVENSWVNARKNRLRYGVYRKLPQLLVSNMFIKYNANGEPISYTSADIRPNDLSTNAFGAGAYAKTGAKNYAIRQVAGYRVGLFALEGDESYGYCKNSDLTRMDCAEVARVYARFLKEEKGCDLVIAISHCGMEEDRATARAQEGFLDVIQNAHDHLAYDQPIVENGVIMTSTGCYAQNLGVLSLQKTSAGWTWVPEETCCYELTKAYDYEDPRDLSPEALAYRSMQDLLARYDADLTAPDGYFSKLGLDDVTPDSVVMTIPTGYDYIQYEDGKAIGYTYIQSPVTAFICDSFNYASGSQVSFVFGGYVRTALYQGDFTVADAFNEQSTGESAIDHSAGSSLVVCDLSGAQLASICVFDAACSGVTPQGRTYGGAGTLHTGNLRYRYHISDGQISCDVSSIEVYFPESDSWQPLDFHKAYSTSFTFESSQNLVSLLPWASKMATGQALPFAPYDEATGTYMDVPSDNKSEEYYRFWAPYCRGKGVLEGTSYELKSWTALYYYAASMNGTLSDAYTPDHLMQTRIQG